MTPRFDGPGGPRLSPTVRARLGDARDFLEEAAAAHTSPARYVAAHLAALRAAAAVLAARPRPMDGRRRRLRSAWELLPEAEPRLAEWAPYFEASAARRASIEAGMTHSVSARDAEELISEAERFVVTVEEMLGLPAQPALPGRVPLAG
ncbi:SAV_6107 family HEPN domain-containing protein [Planomonospora corallina]|uniref:SAV_6107 family HEPN domain-containing protein n=1 Tax=Planomonospora corallina TaxID=1806052 RepID=A0ABV8I6K3_9ACTN